MEELPASAPFVDPDGALVQEFLSSRPGDMRAFETLVSKYQKQLVANCRYLTADPASADDLAQEVFVKVYFGLRRFEGRSSFRRWMQSIKVKHCLTYLRKERRHRFMEKQQGISKARLKRFKNQILDILVDQIDGDTAIGRSYADAPEIDGLVYVQGASGAKAGDMLIALKSGNFGGPEFFSDALALMR